MASLGGQWPLRLTAAPSRRHMPWPPRFPGRRHAHDSFVQASPAMIRPVHEDGGDSRRTNHRNSLCAKCPQCLHHSAENPVKREFLMSAGVGCIAEADPASLSRQPLQRVLRPFATSVRRPACRTGSARIAGYSSCQNGQTTRSLSQARCPRLTKRPIPIQLSPH